LEKLCKSGIEVAFCTTLGCCSGMIIRDIAKELIQCAAEYPVVTVLGPRQSGKTTLVQMTFPGKTYFSLEDPDIRLAAAADPRGFLNQMDKGGILDEVQRFPVLLSYIQGIVDKGGQSGPFILTGSQRKPGGIKALTNTQSIE